MYEPIEDAYFNWLCAKVTSPHNSIYLDLLRNLHREEFMWTILGDSNRAEDGLELRDNFLRETNYTNNDAWYRQECSVLEMLIAFSKRAGFQTDAPAKDWFWEIIANLELGEYRTINGSDLPVIDDILHTFIWRLYGDNGQGGMFPLRWPKRDQREVEIWYQFYDYLEDQRRM